MCRLRNSENKYFNAISKSDIIIMIQSGLIKKWYKELYNNNYEYTSYKLNIYVFVCINYWHMSESNKQ